MPEKYFEQLSSAYVAHFSRRLSDLVIEQGSELLAHMSLVTPVTAISAILFIDENQDVTVANMAEALGVSHQMVTQRINALEKLGLIERTSAKHDKRAKQVVLTDLGLREAKQLKKFTLHMTRVFDDFEKELGVELTKTIRQAELALIQKPLAQRINVSALDK